MRLRIKNWSDYQHYKDRSPPWIKLHRQLLNNHDYFMLRPESGKALPLIWILASETEGLLPDVETIAFRLHSSVDEMEDILDDLAMREFLIPADASGVDEDLTAHQRVAKENGFGQRNIPESVKRAVWARDGGRCCRCGSEDRIEYDHVVPVSKGGESTEDNVQLLCRPCNRSKRARSTRYSGKAQRDVNATAGLVEQPAPHRPAKGLAPRSLETEREEEVEVEAEAEALSGKDSIREYMGGDVVPLRSKEVAR